MYPYYDCHRIKSNNKDHHNRYKNNMNSVSSSQLNNLPRDVRILCMNYCTCEELLIMQHFHRGKFMIKCFWNDLDKILVNRIVKKLKIYLGDATKEFIRLLHQTKSQSVALLSFIV